MSDFCRRGFHDAYDYLKRHDYLHRGTVLERLRRSRRLSFSVEWKEAIERKNNRLRHEKIDEEDEEDELENEGLMRQPSFQILSETIIINY